MKHQLKELSEETVNYFIQGLEKLTRTERNYYLSEIILNNVLEGSCPRVALQSMNDPDNGDLRAWLLSKKGFSNILEGLFMQAKGQCFINSCTEELQKSDLLLKIKPEGLTRVLFWQFRTNKMDM